MGSTPSPHSSLLPRHNFIPSFFTSFPSVAQGDMEWVVWSVQHILSLPLLPPQRKDSSQSSSMVPPTGHNPLWNFPSLCLGIFSGHAHRARAQGTLRYVRELWKWRHLYVRKQALTHITWRAASGSALSAVHSDEMAAGAFMASSKGTALSVDWCGWMHVHLCIVHVFASVWYLLSLVLPHTRGREQEQTDKKGDLQIQLPLTIRKLNVI